MRMLMQFEGDPSEPGWVVVNDDVMGGRSRGAVVVADGELRFTGMLSLANNGGFSSIRTRERNFDFTAMTNVVLKVRGDGRVYQLRVATDARFHGISISYAASFQTTEGKSTLVRVGLTDLKPTARGTPLDGPQLDPSQVRAIGLLIGDKREGAFSLAVDWIGLE